MYNKTIKEIIIISDYDGGYGLTVWYKGNPDMVSSDARNIRNMYDSYKYERSIKDIIDKYKCDVLVCCDGGIEYFEHPLDNVTLL